MDKTILPQDEIAKAAEAAFNAHCMDYGKATTYMVPDSCASHSRILFRKGVEWERARQENGTIQSKDTIPPGLKNASGETQYVVNFPNDSDFVRWMREHFPRYQGLTEEGDSKSPYFEGFNEGLDAAFAALRKAKEQAKGRIEITDDMLARAMRSFWTDYENKPMLEDTAHYIKCRIDMRRALEAALNG